MLYCSDADTVADPTDADITDAGDKMRFFVGDYLLNEARRRWDERWNDPEWVRSNTNLPFVGQFFKTRYQDLYNAEERRYYDDFYRHTGARGSQYWTRRGENRYDPITIGDYFEVTEAIMSLYGGKKW